MTPSFSQAAVVSKSLQFRYQSATLHTAGQLHHINQLCFIFKCIFICTEIILLWNRKIRLQGLHLGSIAFNWSCLFMQWKLLNTWPIPISLKLTTATNIQNLIILAKRILTRDSVVIYHFSIFCRWKVEYLLTCPHFFITPMKSDISVISLLHHHWISI